ncbi:MAG TPA: CoA transferase [Acidimicrobiales bacterium]|nr:CoA transferase [Acidimicrobiales bacterium]
MTPGALAARVAELDAAALWASSGAMALTGDADGPPLPVDAPVAAVVHAAGEALGLDDAAVLLGERAAIFGFTRRGRVSCGGGARLLPAADGWVAVALPRPVDRSALPAWLGIDPPGDPWPAVALAVAGTERAALVEGARLLEVPCTALGEHPAAPTPCAATQSSHADPVRDPLVVDLSALWAGPLCAQLIGGRVVKVEDPSRPDGARHAPQAFLGVLNAGKRSVAVDLAGAAGRRQLARLLDAADVVVSSSRPRAFEALGVDVDDVLARSPTVWVAVTAHGWEGPGRDRVGFGDDAAVAAGVVAAGPRFAADAVADPLTGVLAAVAARAALAKGGSWFVDAPLVRAAAFAQSLAGAGGAPAGGGPAGGAAAPPRARHPAAPAAALGADTDAVLAALAAAG